MTLLIALLLAADPPAARQVTLPIDEYERLRKLEERPSLTVVELLRVEGSFSRRDLAVTLTGRAAGTWPTAAVLAAEGVRLHSCQGDGLLSRDDSGQLALTPLAPRFQVRCKVGLDGSDRLEARATAAVLEVAAAVEDGELVASAGAGGREFSVVRRLKGDGQELPPSIAARYQVTLLPDEARFAYHLEVRNPSRGHRRFEIALAAGEHVEGVDAPVAWDVEGVRYRFDLPPGETAVELRGRLAGARFTPPVDASLQYLLVESHPLIRPEVRSGAKRVGVGETGLSPRYRGAQAFLLDGGAEVTWTATRLEALKTAGLALGDLRQVFFLAADGKARGEATFAIDNQGAPALTLPTAGDTTTTFASVGGEPAFLTRDAEGRLFLPLAQGAQQVVVQDARPFGTRLGVALARLELPRPGVPASRAEVQLRYPAEWIPVYEELAPHVRWHLLGAGDVAALLLLLAAAERVLALAGLSRRRRWLLAGALVLLGALSPAARTVALALALLPLLALGAALAVRRLTGAARVLALLGGAAAVLVAAGAFGIARLVEDLERGDVGSGYYNASSKLGARESPAESPGSAPALEAGAAASFEGLPAKIEIPAGLRQTSFTRELLATDVPRRAFAVMVSARLVAVAAGAAGLLLLALALLYRRELVSGARTLAARFTGTARG